MLVVSCSTLPLATWLLLVLFVTFDFVVLIVAVSFSSLVIIHIVFVITISTATTSTLSIVILTIATTVILPSSLAGLILLRLDLLPLLLFDVFFLFKFGLLLFGFDPTTSSVCQHVLNEHFNTVGRAEFLIGVFHELIEDGKDVFLLLFKSFSSSLSILSCAAFLLANALF